MKRSILCLVVLALGYGVSASNTATVAKTSAPARAACCVDDPPPEPVDCPMCGGNANVHARRLILIQQQMHDVALYATRW